MTENHDRFLQHLDQSGIAVAEVARWLSGTGRTVMINGVTRAMNHDEWESHADSGDLYVMKRIEVKRLSVSFTSHEDWPFNDKFIVCAKHSWDRAQPKPEAFIIMNRPMSHVAMVPGHTSRHWYSAWRTDSRYSGNEATQEFYFCPLEFVTFKSIRP